MIYQDPSIVWADDSAVPDWVSSLSSKSTTPTPGRAKLGFEHATLRWNTGKKSDVEVKTPPKKTIEPPSPTSSDGTTAVDTPETVIFNLTDLTLDFPIGKLTIITGPTGAGKTGILIALLGEMELLEGKTWLPKETTGVDSQTGLRNSIAYAAQTPWLQQKSIKDNILFGEEFDEDRYEHTLDACAL